MTNPTGPYGQEPQQGQQPASSPYAPTQAMPAYNPQGQQGAAPNPYGAPTATQAPANPYGAPQPGPNPYGAPAQNPYGQLGVNAQGAADDKSLSKRLGVSKQRLIGIAVALVVVAGFGVYKVVASKSDPGKAQVGDCLSVNDTLSSDAAIAKSAKKTACTDTAANYKVVGRVDDTSDLEKCSTTPGYKDGDAAFSQESGSKSYVLCLEPMKK